MLHFVARLCTIALCLQGVLTMAGNALDYTLTDIDGRPVELKQYAGKVVLIVNVASRCGYTSQYAELEQLYLKYKDQGLVILGFPANNFLGQEPGTDAEIKQFCSLKYNVTFPMFAKISVKGDDIAPLYKFLTAQETQPEGKGNISWNFNKFLLDRKGNVACRFGTRLKPSDPKLVAAVEKLLAEKP
jgi:glutathione peroxidase